jgi:hypothetical protein
MLHSGLDMREKALDWQRSSGTLLYLVLFLIVSFAIIYSLSIDKHLSSDGAHYFATILDSRSFKHPDWARWFAAYLTQWPLVLAVTLKIKSIPLLIDIYSVGIYFPYIASFLLCIHAVRKENASLLAFPILSMIAINLSGDYILVGEHHVMTLLSWPILLLLLRREPLAWLDGSILWLLLFLFSRTYEAAIVPEIIFSLMLGVKLYKNRLKRKQLIIYGIALLLNLLAMPIALYFILHPRDSTNESDFIRGLLRNLLNNKAALVTTSFTFFSAVGLILRKKTLILASLFPIVAYVCILLFSSHGPTAWESFISRTMTLSLLPLLLVCAALFQVFNVKPNRVSNRILVVFVLTMTLGNVHFSKGWNDFRSQVIDIVTTKNQYVSIEETGIKDSPDRWHWNNSELGIILSYPCVKSILLNAPGLKWEPFNPRKELILKDYVGYDAFFSQTDKNITGCQ